MAPNKISSLFLFIIAYLLHALGFRVANAEIFFNSCFGPCEPPKIVTKPEGFLQNTELTGFCGDIDGNPHIIPPEFCSTLFNSVLVKNECGCQDPANPFECPVCREGEFISKPDAVIQSLQVNGTCSFINDNQLLIPEDFCPIFQDSPIVREICGCIIPSVQGECPVCGPDQVITIPDGELASAEVLGTCEFLNTNQQFIPKDFCPTLQVSTIVKDICGCVPSTSPAVAPTTAPTTAPVGFPGVAPTPAPAGFCFSALNKVEVQGKGLVPISKLEIGDMIRASNDAFSPVLGFGKRQHDKIAQYLQLFSEGLEDTPLELTNDHMVFASGKFVAASEVRVGDMLGRHRVVAIKEVLRRGAYAPVTESGDLVVGGVLASCYTSMLDYSLFDRHAAFHAFMAPFRAGWISRWSYDEDRAVWIREWCPRLSSLKYVLSPLMQYLVSSVVVLIYVVSGAVWLVEGGGPMMVLSTLSLAIAGYRLYGGGRSKVKGF